MQTATHVRNTEISACLSWVELSLPVLQPWNNICLKTKSRKTTPRTKLLLMQLYLNKACIIVGTLGQRPMCIMP